MTSVNQMDFTQDSGSCAPLNVCYRVASLLVMPQIEADKPDGARQPYDFVDSIVSSFPEFSSLRRSGNKRQPYDFTLGDGTTCSAVYTYYQRVYDNINTFWCYYSGPTVNESPGMTDTTPHNSGDISGYSIIYVIDQIVCSQFLNLNKLKIPNK